MLREIWKFAEKWFKEKFYTYDNYPSEVGFITHRNLAVLYGSYAAYVYHVVVLSWIHSNELFTMRITNRMNLDAFVNKFWEERTESGTVRYVRVE